MTLDNFALRRSLARPVPQGFKGGTPLNQNHPLSRDLVAYLDATNGAYDVLGREALLPYGDATTAVTDQGKALSFGGGGQYRFGRNPLSSASAGTIWIKFKLSALGAAQCLYFEYGGTFDNVVVYAPYSGSGNRMVVRIGSSTDLVCNRTSWQTERWYQVAITFSAEAVKVYVDGALDATFAGAVTKASTYVASISGYAIPGNWDQAVNGKIAHLGLWRRALSAGEVAALYTRPGILHTPERRDLHLNAAALPVPNRRTYFRDDLTIPSGQTNYPVTQFNTSSGHQWVLARGSDTPLVWSSYGGVMTNGGPGTSIVRGSLPASSADVQIKYRHYWDYYGYIVGVTARMNAAGTSGYLVGWDPNTSRFNVYRLTASGDASATTPIATSSAVAVTRNMYFDVQLNVSGASPVLIEVLFNGVSVLRFSDGDASAVTAAGYSGVYFAVPAVGGTSSFIESFSADELVAVAASTPALPHLRRRSAVLTRVALNGASRLRRQSALTKNLLLALDPARPFVDLVMGETLTQTAGAVVGPTQKGKAQLYSGSGQARSSRAVLSGQAAASVSLWFKLSSYVGGPYAILAYESNNNYDTFGLFAPQAADQPMRLTVHSNTVRYGTKANLELERWYHVVVTYDAQATRLYIDGQLDSVTAGISSVNSSAWPTCFNGSWWTNNSSQYFANATQWGQAIWGRTLSAAEVQQLYQEPMVLMEPSSRTLWIDMGIATEPVSVRAFNHRRPWAIQPPAGVKVSRAWQRKGLVALFDTRQARELISGDWATNRSDLLLPGAKGKAAEFSGSANQQYAHRAAYATTGAMTLVALLEVDALSDYGAIIAKQSSTIREYPYEFRLSSLGTYGNLHLGRAGLNSYNGSYGQLSTTYLPADSKPAVVAITANNDQIASSGCAYVRGAKIPLTNDYGGVAGGEVSADNGAPVWIGRRYNGGTQLDGRIYYVALFNRALTDQEIAEITAQPWSLYESASQSLHMATAYQTTSGSNPPPTFSGSLSFTHPTLTGYRVNWPAATDNGTVAGYELSFDGGTTWLDQGTQLYLDVTGRSTGSTDTVRVRAYDDEGLRSTELVGTTTVSDQTAPTFTSGVSFSNLSGTSYDAFWLSASDDVAVVGYEYRVASGNWVDVGNVLTAHVTNRPGGNTELFEVRAYDAAGNKSAIRSASVTLPDQTGPSFSAGLTLTPTSATSVSASWQAASDNVGVADYEVQLNGGAWQSAGLVLSYAFTGLANGSTPTVQVRAKDSAGNYGSPISASATLPDTQAPVMGSLSHTPLTSTSYSVGWSPASDNVGVAGYETSLNGAAWVDRGNVGGVNITGRTQTSVDSIAVRAYDAAGNRGDYVTLDNLRTLDTTVPSAPGALQLSDNTTGNSYTISWAPASDNVAVAGYEISVNSTTAYVDIGNVSSYAFTGRTSGATETVRVRAYDAAGNRSGSVASRTVTVLDVYPPVFYAGGVTFTGLTSTGFTANWPGSTDNVAVANIEINFNHEGWVSYAGTSRTKSFTNLTVNTSYNVQVRARDAANNYSDVLEADVYLSDKTAPSAPGALSFELTGRTSYLVHWGAASDNVGVAGYELSVAGGSWVNVGDVLSVELTDGSEGVTRGHNVRAYDAAGNYGTATAASFKVPDVTAPVFQAQTELSFSQLSSTGYRVNWGAVKDNFNADSSLIFEIWIDDVKVWGPTTGSFTGVTLGGRPVGATEHVRVVAKDVAGNAAELTGTVTVPDTTAPTWPSGTAITYTRTSHTTYTLQWVANSDNVAVAGYEVSVGNNISYVDVGNVLSYDGEGAEGTTFNVYVRAYDAAGNRSEERSRSVVLSDITPPVWEGELSFTSITSTGFRVGWPKPTDNLTTAGNFSYEIFIDDVSVWGPNRGDYAGVTLSGRQPGVTYAVRVVAKDLLNNSAQLSSSVTTVDTTVPTWPSTTQKAVSDVTDTGYTLSWTPANDNVGVAGYEVSLDNAGSTWIDVGLATSFVVTDRPSGSQQWYHVRAYDAAGNRTTTVTSNHPAGSLWLLDVIAPVWKPTAVLSVNGNSGGNYTVFWEAGAATDARGVAGYEVSIDQGESWAPTTATTYTNIRNRTAGQTDTVWLRAYDAAGNRSEVLAREVLVADTVSPVWSGSTLSFSDLTETEFTVSWPEATDNVALSHYGVTVGTTVIIVPAGQTSLRVTGRPAARSELIKVYAEDTSKRRAAELSGLVERPDWTPPTAPKTLAFSGIWGHGYKILWDLATDTIGVTNYEYSLDDGVTWTRVASYPREATIVDRPENTTDRVHVRAVDKAGNAGPAVIGEVTTKDTNPPTWDGEMVFSNIGGGSFTVSWPAALDNLNSVQRYDYRLNGSNWVGFSPSAMAARSYSFYSLANNTAYTLEIRAMDTSGNYSAPLSGSVTTLDTTPPTAPGVLTVVTLSDTGYTVSWAPSTDASGIARYEVSLGNSSNWVDHGLATTLTRDGLAPLTVENVYVRAVDNAGNKSATRYITVRTLDPDAPLLEGEITLSNITSGGFKASWPAAIDASGRPVTYYYKLVNVEDKWYSTSATSISPSGLPSGTEQLLEVRARDVAGNYSQSLYATAQLIDDIPPSAPSALVVSNLTPSSYTVSWPAASDNKGVAGYRFAIDDVAQAVDIGNVTSLDVSGRTPWHVETVFVQAYDAAGNFSTWRAAGVRVPDWDAPQWSGELSADQIGGTGFRLHWSAATDNVGVVAYQYRIVGEESLRWYGLTSNNSSLYLSGFVNGSAVTVEVSALDAAQNRSAIQSLSVQLLDTLPPTISALYAVDAITDTGYRLYWGEASDNVAVTGYELSLDSGVSWSDVGNVLEYAVTGRTQGTIDATVLRAYDAAGNKSAKRYLNVALLDVEPPVPDEYFLAKDITSTGYTLDWKSATDNVAVAGYEYRLNGAEEWTDVQLQTWVKLTERTPDTVDVVELRVYDSSGNRSEPQSLSVQLLDAIAPVLSNAQAAPHNADQALLSVDTDEAGGVMYVVLTTAATPPDAAWILRGKAGEFEAAASYSSKSVSAAGTVNFTVGNLNPNAQYYAHFVQRDRTGWLSNVASSSAIQTDAAPSGLVSPQSQTVWAGEVVTFTASAQGVPAPSYRWWTKASGNAADPWVEMVGQTTGTLDLGAVTLSQNGLRVKVQAYNRAGTLESLVAVLTVVAPNLDLTLAVEDQDGDDDFGFALEVTLFAEEDPPSAPDLSAELELYDQGDDVISFTLETRADPTATLPLLGARLHALLHAQLVRWNGDDYECLPPQILQ